jgi:hypothetical protein
MLRPIVVAHHLIWTAYGWWLPNDPRGSMSNFVSSEVIYWIHREEPGEDWTAQTELGI